ncbi:MAG: peptidylprolyl isomerase [Bacteroidales bacterium]|nr:peptidylprolyl isomerase [Bacteroidales bacterium]
MKVSKNRVISLTYELRVDHSEGDVVESLSPDAPLTFLFGQGQLLPKFEENIDGLAIGEEFDFNLKDDEGYGPFSENSIVNVPIHAFEVDGKIDNELLQIGRQIPMQDSQGNRLNGIVTEINDETVKMDFNHPLAGKALFFKGKITEIREATEDEMHHGHAHTEHSCEGCDHCGGEGGHC